jgi:hypothetical protein
VPANSNAVTVARRAFPDAEIREQPGEMLASSTFAEAPMLSRLLRYLVEQTLAGKANLLMEYLAGMKIFSRGASSTSEPTQPESIRGTFSRQVT